MTNAPDSIAAQRDNAIAERNAAWQTVQELRFVLKEITGHVDMIAAFVLPNTTARRNIDGAVARATAALDRVK